MHPRIYCFLPFVKIIVQVIYCQALSPKIIAIVPQMKGSVAAIERLVNHIFDSYAEGKIVDYSEVAC